MQMHISFVSLSLMIIWSCLLEALWTHINAQLSRIAWLLWTEYEFISADFTRILHEQMLG